MPAICLYFTKVKPFRSAGKYFFRYQDVQVFVIFLFYIQFENNFSESWKQNSCGKYKLSDIIFWLNQKHLWVKVPKWPGDGSLKNEDFWTYLQTWKGTIKNIYFDITIFIKQCSFHIRKLGSKTNKVRFFWEYFIIPFQNVLVPNEFLECIS